MCGGIDAGTETPRLLISDDKKKTILDAYSKRIMEIYGLRATPEKLVDKEETQYRDLFRDMFLEDMKELKTLTDEEARQVFDAHF